jgi:hypothetical protein
MSELEAAAGIGDAGADQFRCKQAGSPTADYSSSATSRRKRSTSVGSLSE